MSLYKRVVEERKEAKQRVGDGGWAIASDSDQPAFQVTTGEGVKMIKDIFPHISSIYTVSKERAMRRTALDDRYVCFMNGTQVRINDLVWKQLMQMGSLRRGAFDPSEEGVAEFMLVEAACRIR